MIRLNKQPYKELYNGSAGATRDDPLKIGYSLMVRVGFPLFKKLIPNFPDRETGDQKLMKLAHYLTIILQCHSLGSKRSF